MLTLIGDKQGNNIAVCCKCDNYWYTNDYKTDGVTCKECKRGKRMPFREGSE